MKSPFTALAVAAALAVVPATAANAHARPEREHRLRVPGRPSER
ncbi:hypothetical protein ACTWPT_19810 [Nonomuraea sp. 3N208]